MRLRAQAVIAGEPEEAEQLAQQVLDDPDVVAARVRSFPDVLTRGFRTHR